MIPEQGTLRNIPYECSAPSEKPMFGIKDSHYRFRHDKSRCNIVIKGSASYGKDLKGEKTETGEAVFLPWQENHITSVRLNGSSQGGSHAFIGGSGPRFFFTANMQGCKFYVDTIKRSNDVIVYHANAKRQDPGGANRAPNSQLPACVERLDELHRHAQVQYRPIINKNIIAFGKRDYFQGANPLLELKRTRALPIGVRKRQVEWTGSCFVCGYLKGVTWKFYYQTHGMVTYTRPSGLGNILLGALAGHWKYLHKLRKQGKKGTVRGYEVISWGEIPRV